MILRAFGQIWSEQSMSRSTPTIAVAILMVVVFAGCGPKHDAHKLAKERVEIYEKMAEVYAKVTDKSQLQAADADTGSYAKRLNEITAALNEVPADKKEEALTAQKQNLEAAMKRLEEARADARKK